MEKEDLDNLLSTEEAAEILGMSPRTLEDYRYKGAPEPGLPFIRIGQSVRYWPADVHTFLKSKTVDKRRDASTSGPAPGETDGGSV